MKQLTLLQARKVCILCDEEISEGERMTVRYEVTKEIDERGFPINKFLGYLHEGYCP